MNKKLQLKRLIDSCWSKIKADKAALLRLYDLGEPLTSDKLIQLARQIDTQWMRLVELDKMYEALLLQEP